MCNIEMVWGRCHVILKLRSLSTLIKIQIEHVILKVETDEMDEDYHMYFYFSIIPSGRDQHNTWYVSYRTSPTVCQNWHWTNI